ncbi:PP2C family protein-serine/threonine phosphatase [Thermocatellispora tengchongensis]
MSARYVPAPRSSHVGGDWYDAFTMSDGATALVIGDVAGHDLDAAAGMAQVCNMLRAYAGAELEPPSTIVDHLDQAMARMAETTMATAVFARVELTRDEGWRLRWTNAGHPPPLLVEHDGRARFLEAGQGMLLGTGIPTARADAVTELPPRSTLVLYTDGLIESPRGSIDAGLSRLREYAASLPHHPLHAICDLLLTHVRPDDNNDDVAMLVLRLPGDARVPDVPAPR